jgi:iron complex transport system substrate-binding protein
VAGPRSYVGTLLDVAGGDNAVGDLEAPYPQISPETIVARRPEILIDATHGTDEAAARAFWSERFPDLPAMRAGRVHALAESAVVRPGPRIPVALRALEALLRPEDGR